MPLREIFVVFTIVQKHLFMSALNQCAIAGLLEYLLAAHVCWTHMYYQVEFK
jgi:hypothetical protein